MEKKEKLLILTGAGFSMPFLKINKTLLSTDFLTEATSDEKVARELMSNLLKYTPGRIEKVLNAISSANSILKNVHFEEKLCFEEKLYELELISELIESYPINSITETTVQNRHVYLKRKIYSSLLSKSENVLISTKQLDYIKNYLLDLVGKFESTPEDLSRLGQWMSILQNKYDVNYFTLNYDNLFEQITKKTIEPNEEDLIVGPKSAGNYQNLHGSIHFVANYDLSIKSLESASIKRWAKITETTTDGPHFHAMISGYNKASKLQNNGYDWIYLSFVNEVFRADELMILGYSFRDDHINRIIKYAIALGKKIKVIDKSKRDIPNRLVILVKESSVETSKEFDRYYYKSDFKWENDYCLKIPDTNIVFYAQDINQFIG